jgi:hypothetical protein
LLLIWCFIMFNKWLMICFLCSNTYSWCMESIFYGLMIICKNRIYSNTLSFWCFCSVLEVHVGHFDVVTFLCWMSFWIDKNSICACLYVDSRLYALNSIHFKVYMFIVFSEGLSICKWVYVTCMNRPGLYSGAFSRF